MYRLVYISTPKQDISRVEVASILRAGRKNNVKNGITGLLIQDRRRFLQYLEGEQTDVEQTFARISNDRRHSAIIPLKSGYIGRRQFPKWEMASKYVDAETDLLPVVRELVRDCDRDVASELMSFAEARDRAA
ncbi:MAG: BLUF domain-containing protein [Parasphingorhabdus sp.]|uniref:BLUF domain-containing protein n=1 Tax=Parasphingorhabdus sp. TaxID=2709688 RepID=UPI003299EADA